MPASPCAMEDDGEVDCVVVEVAAVIVMLC